MTVGKLEKILASIKNKRMKISVEKDTLWDGNGCFQICHVDKAEEQYVPLADDDGFMAYTKAGVERGSIQLVLKG